MNMEYLYQRSELTSTGFWLEFCRMKLPMTPKQFCKVIERTEDDYRDIIRGKIDISDECRIEMRKLITKAHWEKLQ